MSAFLNKNPLLERPFYIQKVKTAWSSGSVNLLETRLVNVFVLKLSSAERSHRYWVCDYHRRRQRVLYLHEVWLC